MSGPAVALLASNKHNITTATWSSRRMTCFYTNSHVGAGLRGQHGQRPAALDHNKCLILIFQPSSCKLTARLQAGTPPHVPPWAEPQSVPHVFTVFICDSDIWLQDENSSWTRFCKQTKTTLESNGRVSTHLWCGWNQLRLTFIPTTDKSALQTQIFIYIALNAAANHYFHYQLICGIIYQLVN